KLDGGIFFLTPDELPRLSAGEDLSGEIAGRRRRRAAALSLEVPSVLFSDDLDAIGRPLVVAGAESLKGRPLSAGDSEGRGPGADCGASRTSSFAPRPTRPGCRCLCRRADL